MMIISELFNDAKFILKFRSKLTKQQHKLEKKAPKIGALAPDFTLSDSTGTESVTMSNFRGKKPVALVFGSFT